MKGNHNGSNKDLLLLLTLCSDHTCSIQLTTIFGSSDNTMRNETRALFNIIRLAITVLPRARTELLNLVNFLLYLLRMFITLQFHYLHSLVIILRHFRFLFRLPSILSQCYLKKRKCEFTKFSKAFKFLVC